MILPNGLDICIATYAILAAGAQATPLNPLYTERELAEILADARPKILLCDSAKQELLTGLAQKLAIEHAISVGGERGRCFDQWKDDDLTLTLALPEPDSLAMLQYTGGTTGRAKGVNLSHRATAINVAQREGLLPTGRDDERILCAMPLFHAYALAMGLHLACYCRGSLIIRPRYHPEDLLQTIERERISIFPGSPTIFTGLMNHERFAATDFFTIHTCYSGSAPLSEETLKRWEQALGAPVYEGYGQTEAGPVLTFNPVDGVRKPGSVGIAVAGTEIQIVDSDTGGNILNMGEIGEIRARGPQLMAGYRNLPEETAQALRDGWLYTGDIGELDADGYLYIRDRKKDMVIVGGYNVYPREVDEVLFMHPAVLDAAAVGAADSYRGEVIRAYVVLRQDATADTGELHMHCEQNLAKYKRPISIDIVAALPKTTVNKTDKNALREQVRRDYPG
jgi:long-chain acyl-CoA synthetase